jgi:tRNA 2-thiouridine synthesizing protein A
LIQALQQAEPGIVVELITDDPLARIDAPHFVSEAGHELLGITEAANVLSIRVRKRSKGESAARRGGNDAPPG